MMSRRPHGRFWRIGPPNLYLILAAFVTCCIFAHRRVDLNKIDFDDSQLRTLPLGGSNWNKDTVLLQVDGAGAPIFKV